MPMKILSWPSTMSYILWNTLLFASTSWFSIVLACKETSKAHASATNLEERSQKFFIFATTSSWYWNRTEKPDGENFDCDTDRWNVKGRVQVLIEQN